MKSKILRKETLTFEMTRFTLEKPWDFLAGQYTTIEFKQKLSYFSMASSPLATELELDIQNSPLHPLDPDFAVFLQTAQSLDLGPPQGSAVLTSGNRPLLLVAGGSGIAPLKSIAETAKTMSQERAIHLYWGVRNEACFYHLAGLEYHPVVSGFVHEVVLQDFNDLSPFDIYIAGPFAMAFSARDAFLKQGAKLESIFSDAFAFA